MSTRMKNTNLNSFNSSNFDKHKAYMKTFVTAEEKTNIVIERINHQGPYMVQLDLFILIPIFICFKKIYNINFYRQNYLYTYMYTAYLLYQFIENDVKFRIGDLHFHLFLILNIGQTNMIGPLSLTSAKLQEGRQENDDMFLIQADGN